MSSRTAKALLARLLALGVLRDGQMRQPRITVETVEMLSREALPEMPTVDREAQEPQE